MRFIDGLKLYYTNILGFTFYFAYFLISLGFCVFCMPKTFNKKEVLRLAIIFVASYITCVAFSSFMFAFGTAVSGNNQSIAQGVFSLSLPIIVLAFTFIFVRGRKTHRFIKTIVLISSTIVIEVLSKNAGFFIGLVTNNNAIITPVIRAIPYLLFPVVCYLLWKIDINRYRNLSGGMIVIITVLSSLLIVVGIYEHYSMTQERSTTALLSVLDIVLLFVLNFSYYATYKNVENRHKITNLEVQKTLEDAERMSIAIDQTNREELEKLRHDIKNQFSYIDVMLQQGNYEEARKYISDYLNTSNPVLRSFSCSNKVINSIINLELTKAKIKNIEIDVKVVVPPLLPFKDNDLVSLLTNMIDNAIENYHREANSPITVRIMKQNDFIRFIVSNPVDMAKINMRTLTKTSKTGRGHGYGTKIIKNIATAYNGYVDFSVEDKHFVCDAVLNLNAKEQKWLR